MYLTKILGVVLTAILFSFSSATAQVPDSERAIQIRTIDLANRTIEVHNFGTTDQSLAGWRFCTHDESEERRYGSGTGLNGVVLPAGESLLVMYNNDASAANELNISALGNFALPLDAEGAYAIQFYFQTPFGSGANIADHLQFSLGGFDNSTADARSSIAEGEVWSNQSAWISVSESTTSISLNDGAEASEISSPDDYTVTGVTLLLGDVNLDGAVDFLDISPFIALLSSGGLQAEADIDQSGAVDFIDISPLIAILSGG